MSFLQIVALIAAVVDIAGGVAAFLRYLIDPRRKSALIITLGTTLILVAILTTSWLAGLGPVSGVGNTNSGNAVIAHAGATATSTDMTQLSSPTATFTQSSASPTVTLGPLVSPTTAPNIVSGSVVIQSDANHGWSGWQGSSDWKVINGVLVNDGTGSNGDCGNVRPTIVPPMQPQSPNYVIDVHFQTPRSNGYCFGISARVSSSNGAATGYALRLDQYGFGYAELEDDTGSLTQSVSFPNDTNWHDCKFVLQNQQLTVYIDGGEALSVQDAKYYATSGQVGLWDDGTYLNVSSFSITYL